MSRPAFTLVLAAFILTVAFSSDVEAGALEDGVAAHAAGDYRTALRLWRPLAYQGSAVAQNNLGVMYEKGQGVPQDFAEGMRWYRFSAAQGFAPAQSNIGFMYAKGIGVPQDYVEAVEWWKLAAAQGDADTQYILGTMYNSGLGVAQDYVQAHMWFNIAASRFSVSEVERRNRATGMRDGLAASMSPAQIAEAQKLAREWKPKP